MDKNVAVQYVPDRTDKEILTLLIPINKYIVRQYKELSQNAKEIIISAVADSAIDNIAGAFDAR